MLHLAVNPVNPAVQAHIRRPVGLRRHSLRAEGEPQLCRACHDRRDRLRADRTRARNGERIGRQRAAVRVEGPAAGGRAECVKRGDIPGGLKANRGFAEGCVEYAADVPEDVRTLLFDPQTAGGLLTSVAETDAVRLLSALQEAGVPAVEIGEVVEKQKPLISVVGWCSPDS